MLNYKTSVSLPIAVVRADEKDKFKLLSHLSEEMDQEKLDVAKNHIMGPDNEIYLVYQTDQTDPLSFIVATEYTRMANSKEIILYYPELIEDMDHYKLIMQQMISILSENNENDYIILKIRDSLEDLTTVAESIGFMKDGIFISNQFLEGEFTFYSVYFYKLI